MQPTTTREELMEEIDLRKLLYLLLDRWPIIILCVVLTVVIAGVFSLLADPVFESTSDVLVGETSDDLMGGVFGLSGGRDSDKMANRLEVINSPLVLDRAKEILGDDFFEESNPHPLRRLVSTNNVSNTDIIRIKVQGDSPERARMATEAVVQAYKEYSQERAQEQSRRLVDFLERQLERTEAELLTAEEAVMAYQREVGIISLDAEASKMNHQITELENRLVMSIIEMEEYRFNLETITQEISILRMDLPAWATVVTERLVEELQTNLATLEAQRIDLLNRGLDKNSPEVSSLIRRIESLEESIREYSTKMVEEDMGSSSIIYQYQSLLADKAMLESQIVGLENRQEILRSKIADYEQDLWKLSDKNYEMALLKREVKITTDTYSLLSQELEKSRISLERDIGDVVLIRPAEAPSSPIQPRVTLNIAIATVLGLFAGVGIVFGMDFMNNTIQDSHQFESLGLSHLGIVPQLDSASQGSSPMLLIEEEDDTDPVTISFIRIESNLRFVSFDAPLKSLLITSALPQEGKSTTTLNLAYTLASSGERVLLIDLDLRKPKIHLSFNEKKEPGLSDIVAGQIEAEHAIRSVEIADGEFTLDYIPAGSRPPRITNLLRSKSFTDLISKFKEEYDWVLIDTPPIHAATDALEIADHVDGIILVVREGKTPIPALRASIDQLQKADGNILGAIMNLSEQKKNRYYSYYNYSYYSYSDRYQDEEENE